LDGLTNTVQQKLNEAAQRVLNTNAPPAEQKPEGTAEETPDKNMPPAGQKPDASSQGVLDKYTRPAEQKPELTISKEELFESWKQQYLIEGMPNLPKSRLERVPRLSKGETAEEMLANTLFNDYGVRCRQSWERAARPEKRDSPMDNRPLAFFLLDAVNTIIKIQYGEQNLNHHLTSTVDRATNNICPQSARQIRQFLDEFAAESENWYQQNIEYTQRKREEEARLAQQKAEQEEAARQQKAEQERIEKQQRADAIAKRTQELRSGQAKIESYSDAQLFYRPEGGQLLVRNPKVQPDGKIYEVFGNLERVEGNTLIVKFADTYYFFISVKEKQPRDFVGNLRIGWPLRVIGRYTSNRQYTTVIGASKTAPTFEAIQLSNNFDH
jgi:hypothetical protein